MGSSPNAQGTNFENVFRIPPFVRMLHKAPCPRMTWEYEKRKSFSQDGRAGHVLPAVEVGEVQVEDHLVSAQGVQGPLVPQKRPTGPRLPRVSDTVGPGCTPPSVSPERPRG